jgi:putative membrane protein
MRRVFLLLGMLTLGAAWLGPLPLLARQAFFAHMIMHMAVVAVAAPLLALAVAGGRFDPARKVPRLFAPVQASVLELIIVWAWHTPALHHAARHYFTAFIAEQGTFLLAGLFLWLSALCGEGLNAKKRNAAGVVGLLLTAMHMTLLGALLALAPRPLYAHVHEHAGGFAGLAPLDDQHLGGAIMLLVGGISYLWGGLWLTARLLREPLAAPLERS